jgi:HSP20 family protein
VTGRRDIERLQAELDELFGDLWNVPRFSGVRRGFRPRIDLYRTEEPAELTIVVELPGVDVESIHAAVDGRELMIAGRRDRPETGPPRLSYYQLEIEYGPFQRHVALPVDVDASGARAQLGNGLLTICIPVAVRPAPPPRVSIPLTAK